MADLSMCPECGTCCGDDWHTRHLRKRLAEVEAERDELNDTAAHLGVRRDYWQDEAQRFFQRAEAAEARLAAVEDERDNLTENWRKYQVRAKAEWTVRADLLAKTLEESAEMEARLAAVEALCDRAETIVRVQHDDVKSDDRVWIETREVRAAARGMTLLCAHGNVDHSGHERDQMVGDGSWTCLTCSTEDVWVPWTYCDPCRAAARGEGAQPAADGRHEFVLRSPDDPFFPSECGKKIGGGLCGETFEHPIHSGEGDRG